MSLWPIYVATKGRPDSKLLKRLADEHIEAIVVVEPQDTLAYRAAFPKHRLVELGFNDQGLGFSRAAILAFVRDHTGPDWFWMIDDDISSFLRFNGTKGIPVDAREALLAAQEEAKPGVGQVCLEYQQYAWSAGGKVKLNSYADVCVGIRHSVPAKFRLPIKGDRDFTMQVIASGYDVRRVTKYAFMAPTPGSNKGGLHADYAAQKDARGAEELVKLWPWCAQLQVKPNGKTDAKIHWKKIRQRRALMA